MTAVEQERALFRFLRAEQKRLNDESFYCPLCDCTKSGCEDTPNRHDEGCSDDHCVCHVDLSAQLNALDRRGDPEPLPFEQGGDAMDWADGNEQIGEGL